MVNDLVTLTEGAKRLGVSTFTLRRRIAEGEISAWANPLDRRARLVRAADLERYAAPRPLSGDRCKTGDVLPLTAA